MNPDPPVTRTLLTNSSLPFDAREYLPASSFSLSTFDSAFLLLVGEPLRAHCRKKQLEEVKS
jgi:hypothetical protein